VKRREKYGGADFRNIEFETIHGRAAFQKAV